MMGWMRYVSYQSNCLALYSSELVLIPSVTRGQAFIIRFPLGQIASYFWVSYII